MRSPTNIASAPINLDHPGTYLHWSIFTVSVSNLVLIAVMVVIFGAALLLPFPKGHTYPAVPAEAEARHQARGAPARGRRGPHMWTNKVRRFATRVLPPGKLLPDRQPAYVASWIYVFGVGALVAFGVAVVSGFALALGGPDWWHYNPVGHFFNSLHLWSIELFMALLVIHLWGKFWMAAWRGKRALTWVTGVLAFIFSVIECFTGTFPSRTSTRMDLGQREGRLQPGRGRRILQHHELRPDADVAHRADPDRAGRVYRRARPAGPGPRGFAPDAGRHPPAGAGQLPAAPPRPEREGCGTLAWPDAALRHPQGRHHRRSHHPGPDDRPVHPAGLPRRALGHRPVLGPGGPGRLPGHRRPPSSTAPAGAPPTGRPTTTGPAACRSCCFAGPAGRGPPAAVPGAGLRASPAEHHCSQHPGARQRAGHLPGRSARPAAQVGQRLRQRRHQGEVRGRRAGRARPPRTGRCRC